MGQEDGLEDGAREAVRLAREAADPVRVARTLITLGNWTAADGTPFYEEAAHVAEAAGYDWGAAIAWSSLSSSYWRAGRTAEALAALIRAEGASERIGDLAGAAMNLSWRGELELNLGQIDAGVEHLEQALVALETTPGLPFMTTVVMSLTAVGQSLAGRSDDAYRTLAAAGDRVADAEAVAEFSAWLEAAGTVLGDRHPAHAARCLGAAGRIAEQSRDTTPGQSLLDAAAARIERSLGARRFEQERTAGRTSEAEDVFRAVVRVVRREAGPGAGRVSAPFGTLSPRESQVLAGLADAKTDAQIADELAISAKTVSVHVANLKSKLGVQTRVEAAFQARERLGEPE
jgi:DNA-binding NarL/FixJ family response regulator